jgi:hypothetical protein
MYYSNLNQYFKELTFKKTSIYKCF